MQNIIQITNPLVSIIVPVYNAQDYINKCATSLLEQTYQNIEYIFINDASTDNSYKQLLDVISSYPNRICKVINNDKNIGSSATRNIGIKHAKGDYINFCDSDDWVEPTMIDEMVQTACINSADVVVTPFYTNTFENESILNYKSQEINNLNVIPLDFQHLSLCNKLTSTRLLKENLSLDGIDCWEDLSIISRIYALDAKVVLLNKPFYHYRKYEYHSLTSSSHERQLNDRLKYTEFLIEWFDSKGLSNKYFQFLNHLKFTSKIKMLRTTPRQYKRWKNTYPESNKYIMSYRNIPFHYRILFYIANLIIR